MTTQQYVVRGNSWNAYSLWLHSPLRAWDRPDYRGRYLGFRLVRKPKPTVGRRVVRGGSWHHKPLRVRSSFRYWNAPALWFNDVGFRVVRRIT